MDPYTWIYLIIAIAVSVALAPKPPKLKPASLDDFDVPTAEEGRPVPVVFGTVRITGPNILWYGDLRTEKIKKSSIMGSTTIGYKYHVGFHFGICHGPVDAFTKFEAGDKTAWSGNITPASVGAAAIAQVRQADLFGGKKKEGGIWGDLYTHFGGPTETVDAYLASEIGGVVPAFRGIFSLVFKHPTASSGGAYIGTTPYPKPFAFTVKRVLKGWLNDAVWYSAKAAIGTGMNPAHIIYETLTNTEWGMGLPADKIDNASFTAAADLLYTEGFGLSLLWNQQASVEDFLSEVINHIAGVLAFDRTTGTYRLKVIRGDYTAGSLPVYGPETISRVTSYQRQGWGETVNELTLGYTDPTTLKDTSVTVHDLANVKAQGVRVATKVDFGGITDTTLAQKVAIRELAARSTPLGKITFTVNRDLWATKKADVLKVTWPNLGIDSMVVRVLRVRQGTLTNGELEIEAVEDIFALALSTYTSQPAPGSDATDPTVDTDDDTAGASVVSSTLTAPPGSPVDGASYLIPTGATGAWAGHAGEVATWDADTSAWIFSTVAPGTVVTDTSTGTQVQTVTGATAVPYTPIQTSGKVIFGTSISPAAIAADQNDYAPTGLLTSSGLRISASGAARNITGLAAGTGGQILLVHNVGALDLTLKDESASSTAANRFALNADVTLKADQSTLLQYDGTSSRWRVIGGTGSGAASVTTTKGDLIVRGASADARLPVGANGLVLMADSAEALGVKWAPVRTVMQSEILADSPVFYAPLDEASGATSATDIVGGLTVSLYSGVTMGGAGPPSNNNRALVNPGTGGSYYAWPKPAAFAASNFSIEFGFYSTATLGAGSQFYSQAAVVMADIGGTANDYGVGFQGAMRPIFGTGNPDTSITPATGSFNDGLLHHCVCTRNGTTGAMEMFIDGVSVATGTGSTGTVGGTSTIWGGLNATNAAFRVFGIAMYNSVLSPSRIAAHYAAVVTGNGSGYVSPTTTAGDLIARNATVDARVPIGTDGQVLTVDTTLPTKVKWATPAAGGGGGGGSGSGADVIGALTFVAKASVTGAASDTLTLSGLDLDAHGRYFVEFQLQNGGASNMTLELTYNSDTTATNYHYQATGANAGSVYSGRANNPHIGEIIAGSGSVFTGMGQIFRNAAGRVQFVANIGQADNGIGRNFLINHNWVTTGVNVTSLRLKTTVAAGMAVGSTVRVWKLDETVRYVAPLPGTPATHVDAPPVTPDAMNDEFNSGTLDSKWTWLYQGAGAAEVKNGLLALTGDRTTAGVNLITLKQPISGSTWKVRTKVSLSALSTSTGYYGAGIAVSNSGNSRLLNFIIQRTNLNAKRLWFGRWNSPTSFNADVTLADNNGLLSVESLIWDWVYFEVESDGTTLYFRYSLTGEEGSFRTHASEAIATFIGGVTDICLSSYTATGTAAPASVAYFQWFRKIGASYSPGSFVTNGGAFVPLAVHAPMTPPRAADFPTWVNQGSATLTDMQDRLVFGTPTNGALNARGALQPTLGTPYTVTVAVSAASLVGGSSGANLAGIMLKNSAGNPVVTFETYVGDGYPGWVRVLHWPTPTTGPSVALNNVHTSGHDLIWLRIVDDGTNRSYRLSGNGRDWVTLSTVARTTHVTPDQVGIYHYNNSGFTSKAVFYHWSNVAGVIGDDASSIVGTQVRYPDSPDRPPANPTAWDDEFESTTLDGKWSDMNLGSTVKTLKAGCLRLSVPTDVTGQWRGVEQVLPSGNWRFETRLAFAGESLNIVASGLVLRENSTGKMYGFYRAWNSQAEWSVNYWTSFSAYVSSFYAVNLGASGVIFRGWGYFAVEYDGTNYYFEISHDGISWIRLATVAKASYFTADRIALASFNTSAGKSFLTCDYFRRVS